MPRTELDNHQVRWGTTDYRVFNSVTGALEYQSSTPRELLRFDEVRHTVNTPDFRRKRKESGPHSLPMNPFEYTKEVHEYPSGIINRDLFPNLNVWSGITAQPFPFAFPGTFDSETSLNGNAQNKLLSNVKDSKVNLLAAIGERQQIVRMLFSTADRLAGAIRAAKNGNIVLAAKNLSIPYAPQQRRRGKFSRQLADDWLALEYGWKPLVSDITGTLEFFAARRAAIPRAKASASDTSRYSRYVDMTGSWGPPTRLHEYGSRTVKYVAYFSSSSEVLSDLSRLGLTNIPSALWELTPWSFVLDWFIRVGEYIDLLDAGIGLTFEKGCRTLFEKETMRYRCSGTRTGDDGSIYHGFSNAKSYRIRCIRTLITSFGGPSLTVGTGVTSGRSLNAVSLLRQKLGK